MHQSNVRDLFKFNDIRQFDFVYMRRRFQNLKHFLMDMCAIDSLVATHISNDTRNVKLTRQTVHGLQSNFKKISRIYKLLYASTNHLSDIFGLRNLTSMGKFTYIDHFEQLTA